MTDPALKQPAPGSIEGAHAKNVMPAIKTYLVRAKTGQLLGEIERKNARSWVARRYGNNYPKDDATFHNQSDAILFLKNRTGC